MKTLKLALILVAFVSPYQLSTTEISANNLVEQVCQKTSNPSLCVSTLESDPKSATSDTKGLANIMCEKASNSANETKVKVIPKLLGEIKDPAVIEKLKICDNFYNMILLNIELAVQYLEANRYEMAIDILGNTAKLANEVERYFSLGPEKRPSPLTDRNKNLMDLAGLAQDIIHMLG